MKSSIVRVFALATMLSAAPFARVGALEIDPNPCFESFDALNEAIDQEGVKDRDRRMMLSKLGDADLKVGALKICDAIDKIEDIINRGGGNLVMELAWASDDESGLEDREVQVSCDGVLKTIPAKAGIRERCLGRAVA